MRRKIMVAACAFAAAVALAAGAKTVDFPIPDAVRSWDIPERATNGVKAVWIENVPWHGKPTRFFAYYSLPEGATAEKKVPGIVLVHGGYGTAFHTWVKLWNDRGYAAIAMDNCGGIPGEKAHTPEHPRHAWSGPNGWGRFEDEALPPEEQWVYHAVECVIRSHTFLRNLPEVDAARIGVTGISWGGFLTSIACGADPRFAFAVPVYGCGNLRRHSVFAPEIGERWESLWNPVEYAKRCRIPTLWCTGTNDYFFPLDSFEDTAFASGKPLFSIKLRMKHGHPPEGDPPEIAAFADSIVKGAPKLTDRKAVRREWLYTSSGDPVWRNRPFDVLNEKPQNWTIRFENALTEDGLILSSPPEFQASARPVPRAAMAARIAAEEDVYGIVHWGLNTYTDREWGYGDEDPAMLNPAKFDADQIVGACRDAGMCGLIVVAKHHDGFCLWPTKTTEHNITKSPFWKGTGNGEQGRDYVKEMEQACRRAGLKFGVYCSPWDRNSAHYATEKYVEIYHAQLKELLGGAYGDIFEMWFDGANGGDGYYGGAREKRRIGADYYRFGEVFKFVRELQPNVTIFSGADDDSDLRWCGNERGFISEDSRATVVRTGGYCDGKYGNPDYVPLYVGTAGNGGTMDIGVAPNKDGVLDADDVQALRDFGELRKALFAHGAKEGGKFNVVVMREDISHGELVDEWEFVADGKAILRGKSIGNKRIRLLKEPVPVKGCEVRVLRGVGTPKVSYALYCADQAVIDAILNAKGDDGETDTAKWMTKGVSAKREFFVSPAGNDASDGSAAHPWRTISHAAAVAEAGDTVTIHAGVYREWVKPANAGREGAPITYRAAKGERVVVTGADEVRGWTKRPDGLWEAHVSYDSFGGVNPFTDFIEGSWFLPKDLNHFRTRLIQCGKPLNLVGNEILAPPDHGVPHLERGTAALIPGRVSGMIVAAFEHDPNVEVPELVVRPCCFYPATTRRDYIALRGIAFRDAAPTWAHPRGEQPGVVGTNWSRGWMIEDCEISGSCCAGLTLGKCANDFDSFWYDPKQSFSLWGKRMSERDLSEVGRHTVRRCRISDCGQAGICGGFGAVWSTIEDCDISRCYWNKKFAGYEMAGIKIHVAVGMTIRRNRIHDNGCFGVWLDWMGQGTRLAQNSLWANAQTDLYLEVVHGPILLEGNDFLSKQAIHFKGSNNIALVGNRIFGLLACDDDKSLGYRKTPIFYPHSTRIKELYTDCMPVNLVFINNIMPETPHFADLAAYPCRCEDNWLVPRTCWKVDEADGNCKIEPTADSPHPDFKPVTAERLGTGLFTGEEFPLPDTDLSTPKRGMKI